MRCDNGNGAYPSHRRRHSDSEIVGAQTVSYSDPISGSQNKKSGGGSRKTVRFNLQDTAAAVSGSVGDGGGLVGITLDVRDDFVDEEDPEPTLLAKGLEKGSSSGSTIVRDSRIKQGLQELNGLASSSRRANPGRFESAAAHALKGPKADGGAGWEAVAKRFDLFCDTNGLLPRSLFGNCVGMKDSKEFAGELFDALVRRRNVVLQGDSINKVQLKEFWDQICDQSFDSRLQTFFDMVDKDADGRITKEEIKEIISLTASANKLSNIKYQAHEYAALIMEELDTDNLGYITIENLDMFLLQAPSHSTRGESRNVSQKLKLTHELNPIRRWYRDFMYFFFENWQRIWIMTLWISIMSGLFMWKFIQYRNRAVYDVMGHCVSVAKGAAETLKLNMALILIPVCRNTITWLRNKTKLRGAVPFDDNLNFHKIIAVAIAIGAGIHSIYHLACDFPSLIHASPTKYAPMEQYFGEQPENYWHFVKSFERMSGIIMVVLMAIAFTLATSSFRRSRVNLPKPLNKFTGFNAFWYSHHLFVVVYGLLIAHGIELYLTHDWYKKTTWMYVAVPVTLYACERLIRAFRSSVKPVKIQKVAIYPGNVMALHMSKPQGFKYKSGQYIFVNCAAVSPFEWHPFQITSAPGDNDLSVHIRIVGDWTRQLKTIFSKVGHPPASHKSGVLLAGFSQGENNPNFPRVLIDGPYGAPAQDYKKYDVVLLFGLGIGACSLISVVKDIVNNMKAMEEEENALENGNGTPNFRSPTTQKRSKFKTRKAYFYWVTREQGSFDWFNGIMNEVAQLDFKGVIEIHNYCTSVYEEGDLRSALISILQSLNHAKNGVDIVSGTPFKTHFAKPNWRKVFRQIALDHTNERVGVFYCGAPAIEKELKRLALDFSRKTSTKFEFHKENF